MGKVPLPQSLINGLKRVAERGIHLGRWLTGATERLCRRRSDVRRGALRALPRLHFPSSRGGYLDGIRRQLRQDIEGTGYTGGALASDMGVNHGCFQALMAEQHLNRPQIDAA